MSAEPNTESQMRVPLPTKPIFASDDVAVSVNGPDVRYARRFSIDIAEDALRDIAPAAVQHVAQRLGEYVARSHQKDIEAAVLGYLRDRAWAEPIIREAIREEVHRYIAGIFAASRANQS